TTAFGHPDVHRPSIPAVPHQVPKRLMTSLPLRSTVSPMTDLDLAAINAERERIRTTYLRSPAERPGPSARGVHHVALLCADVERTVRFYQGVLQFPLTEIFENRDYQGSNHFFFDIGNGNLLAFFDLPGLDL